MKRLTLLLLILSACGTRDYAKPPNPPSTSVLTPQGEQTSAPETPEAETVTPQLVTPQSESTPVLHNSEPPVGYLWRGLRWISLPDHLVEPLKERLADAPNSDAYCAAGSAIFGGAVLGLVIRATGSWFLGGPVDSDADDPFWRKTNEFVKSASQGVVRGAGFGGICYALLTGARPLPYDGLLGAEYRDLSASVVLGTLSAVAVSPPLHRIFQRHWGSLSSRIGRYINSHPRLRLSADKIHEWTSSSELGKSLRYRVAPRLFIVGIGSGVGLLVYQELEDCGPPRPESSTR